MKNALPSTLALLSLSSLATAQSIVDLGALPGGVISPIGAPPGLYQYATATSVSENGLNVGGTSNAVAVRFFLDGASPERLPAAPGGSGGAVTGALDSGYLIGWNLTSGPFRAQTWSPDSARTDRGSLTSAGGDSYLTGISRDGRVAVGYGLVSGQFRAARYVFNQGWSMLPTRPGSGFQLATNISRDGSAVVGVDGLGAFIWRGDSGFGTLEHVPGAVNTVINDISADGRIAVGASAFSATSIEATVWTNGVAASVGSLPGYPRSFLTAVSSSGDAAVGYVLNPLPNVPANDARTYRAVYWSTRTGLIDLHAYVERLGLVLPDGGILTNAVDISGNGRIVVGNYQNSNDEIRAFYLTLPPINCPADISSTDGDLPGRPDGFVDNGDFTAFFLAFFLGESDPLGSAADIANTDGLTERDGLGPDGAVDNGDFTAFFSLFFNGCE